MKCPFCEKALNKMNHQHIYKCSEKPNENKKELKYHYISFNFPEVSVKQTLIDKYEKELYSLPDMKKEFGIPYTDTLFLLDYFDIHIRTAKESANLITKVKYKKTCLKIYGVDNVSNLCTIKEKKKQTFVEHYGVDNIWKSKEYYEWLHDYMFNTYGKKSLPNRYGKMNEYYKTLSKEDKEDKMIKPRMKYLDNLHNMSEEQKNEWIDNKKRFWSNLTDEQKTELIQKRTTFSNTKIETVISDSLNKLNISYRSQYWVGRKSFDFKIEPNVLIEVNGDFWHGNPMIYREDDIIPHPFKSVKAKDLWLKDDNKRKIAEEKGYKVVYFWENELKENKDNILDFVVSRLSQ